MASTAVWVGHLSTYHCPAVGALLFTDWIQKSPAVLAWNFENLSLNFCVHLSLDDGLLLRGPEVLLLIQVIPEPDKSIAVGALIFHPGDGFDDRNAFLPLDSALLPLSSHIARNNIRSGDDSESSFLTYNVGSALPYLAASSTARALFPSVVVQKYSRNKEDEA